MINANEYLEQNYPKYGVCQIDKGQVNAVNLDSLFPALKRNVFSSNESLINRGKKRAEITSLNVVNKILSGTLDLSDFIQLEKLYCNNNQLTQLILPRSAKLRELDCNSNRLTSLNCTNNPHLRKLWCWNNQLTELILPVNNQLADINVANNLLTSFNYACLNPTTLTNLRLFNNNFQATDIAVFSHLVNLVILEIGNLDKWVRAEKVNQFYGSLSSLQKLIKLKDLAINNTNINSGLEYLPASLETFRFYSLADYKVKELEKALNKHKKLFNDNVTSLVLLERWKADFYQKNPNFKSSLIKSMTEERINENKKPLPLVINFERIINPLNKDEISLLKIENIELKTENNELKYKLSEAEDYIEKLEKQLLERKINPYTISNNPQTIVIEEEFISQIEVSNHHPQSIIYRNPQER